jgi:hypothetical protein
MRVLLIPPHSDFTLAWPAPAGLRVMDVARAFIARELTPARLAEAAARVEARLSGAGAEAARAYLLLRAAGSLLEAGGEPHRHLRACGAALAGLSAPPSPVRLRLDDLELARGTTESSAQSLEAALQPGAPSAAVLEEAVEACAGAESVRLWLERDQQLPAVLWLAQALAGRPRLEVAGPFAWKHREVLARLPPLATAGFSPPEEGAGLPEVVGAPGAPQPEALRWVREHARLPESGGPWGGAVPLRALAEPGRLASSGCRLAVLAFCALGEQVVGADGTVMEAEAFAQALEALRREGVRRVGEWWIGAPGLGEQALEQTAQQLEQRPPFDWLAGVRAFHGFSERGSGPWGLVQVEVAAPPPERDLARSRPFSAPGTLGPQELPGRMEALAQRLARRAPLSPGRVAQACVATPPVEPAPGERIRLDGDCAVVSSPVALDGKPGPAWYAVNLRTGLVLAVDARLAPSLAGLRAAALPGEVFSRVPEPQRGKLIRALVDKAVLREVQG